MILRRLNHGAGIRVCLTKSDGGHLRGTLTLGGLAYLIRIAAYNDNEKTFKRPSYLRYVDRRDQELGTLGGWFKTCDVSPERLCLANLCSSRPSTCVEFQPNLDQAYDKEAI